MKLEIFTNRTSILCWLFLSGAVLVSCFGSQADDESLDVAAEEGNNLAVQGQEAYEDNQIALAGGGNELGSDDSELTIGADAGGENQQIQEGNEELASNDNMSEADALDDDMSDITAGDSADVLAEAGANPELTSGQDEGAIENVIDDSNTSIMGGDGTDVMPTVDSSDNYSEAPVENSTTSFPMDDITSEENPTADGMDTPSMVAVTEGSNLPEMGARMTYIVKKGDTLGDIAQAIYNDKTKWRDLARWSGFSNPHLIFPGNIVYYQYTEQAAEFAARYEGQRKTEVTVQAGDTLSGIAARAYGNPANWVIIWRYNGHIANPDRINVGQTIYYPEQVYLTALEIKAGAADQVETADQELDQMIDQEMTQLNTQNSSLSLITTQEPT